MSSTAISVVMPVYNGSRFLARAAESVFAQTFSAWELLAVDDGSSDDSTARLESIAATDPRVRVFRHTTNRGVAAARNTALRAARGELISYLDCDDEFYPDHLARLHELRDRADVFLFLYDLVEERPGHPGLGQVTTHDPAARLGFISSETIAVPLGVAHSRELLDRTGLFDESLGLHRGRDEDGELWRRFARAGVRFLPVAAKSGRYHVRADSHARTRPSPDAATAPAPLNRPRVMFASYHCYHDPASGAAVCTRDLFAALAARGWRCGAFTGPYLDDPSATPIGSTLRGLPGATSAPGTAGATTFTIHTSAGPGGFPVTVFAPDPPAAARPPSPDDTAGFLTVFAEAVRRFRPEVVLTYGGDPASRGVTAVAKSAGARVVFWLHNFAYSDAAAFAGCDAVVVPSRFSRDYHRATIGLECVPLPPVIDIRRVACERPNGGRYVTFVNPTPEKGIFWFARLAEVLGRDRPDIPLLVVEGRGRADWLARCGVDLRGVKSLHRFANTPDPRQFYRLTRTVVMPSVWRESFGRVAAEAMLNGISVLASDRGALPEVTGRAGRCLPIPDHITPQTRTPPTAREVVPWVEAVVNLWDDPAEDELTSVLAQSGAAAWHPGVAEPRWEKFLCEVATAPSGL
jgi:glycosyltransferase involved in cell wall biosynthesis/GT2 family glycosyltransferase